MHDPGTPHEQTAQGQGAGRPIRQHHEVRFQSVEASQECQRSRYVEEIRCRSEVHLIRLVKVALELDREVQFRWFDGGGPPSAGPDAPAACVAQLGSESLYPSASRCSITSFDNCVGSAP